MGSDIADAVLEAFRNVGGAEYLAVTAKENRSAFCYLVGKLTPLASSTETSVVEALEQLEDEEILNRLCDLGVEQ